MAELIDLLPSYYKNSPQVAALQSAFQHWTDALAAAREDLLAQLNVDTATWGLALWERDLGLQTNMSAPYEFRRARVKSKLRGAGTTTIMLIKSVAESFSNGEVDVEEYPEDYRFEVVFTGTYGIPPNMDDLTAAIEEIKPAHLAFAYVFTFMTWNEFDAYDYTWDAWDALNLTWDALEAYKE